MKIDFRRQLDRGKDKSNKEANTKYTQLCAATFMTNVSRTKSLEDCSANSQRYRARNPEATAAAVFACVALASDPTIHVAWKKHRSLISSIDDVVLCVSTFAIVLGGTPSSVVAGGVNDEKKPLGVPAAVPSSNEGVLTRLASWC
ncbi:hypothetical protein E4U48_003991 [Claviceps purpurea]|nr:hypothetical protein E4U48_003991 [Claviceps purpurea]